MELIEHILMWVLAVIIVLLMTIGNRFDNNGMAYTILIVLFLVAINKLIKEFRDANKRA